MPQSQKRLIDILHIDIHVPVNWKVYSTILLLKGFVCTMDTSTTPMDTITRLGLSCREKRLKSIESIYISNLEANFLFVSIRYSVTKGVRQQSPTMDRIAIRAISKGDSSVEFYHYSSQQMQAYNMIYLTGRFYTQQSLDREEYLQKLQPQSSVH